MFGNGMIILIDEIDWKAEYEKFCKESADCAKEFAEYNLQRDQRIFDAFEGSAEELALFKQGFQAAKQQYNSIIETRSNLLRDEKFFLRKKTKELIQAEQKMRDLVAECKLYSDSLREIESHKLTKCVRFLQSFGNRVKYKLRDIYYGGKHFLGAFLPKQYDTRSSLYQTLKKHLNKQETKE